MRVTGEMQEEVFVGRGYRSHEVADSNVFISGLKRVADVMVKRLLK